MMNDTEEQQRGLDASFEDEITSQRTVTIPLKEYEEWKLKYKEKYGNCEFIDTTDYQDRPLYRIRNDEI